MFAGFCLVSAWSVMSQEKFFYNLLPESILTAVEEIGVRCTGRLLQLNSLENRVYEVEIEVNHDEIHSRYEAFRVVKFYRPGRWSKEQILEEHQFLAALSAEDIPVVPALRFSDGNTLRQVSGQDIWFAVFPKFAGRHLDEFNEKQLEKIGRTIARLHLLGAREDFKYRLMLDSNNYGREGLEFLLKNKLLPDLISSRYSEVVQQIFDLCDQKLSRTKQQRVHGDLHFGNTIWINDDCTFVDFDDSLTAPCVQDIWLLAPGRDDESDHSRQVILKGYEQLKSFNYEELRLVEALRALRIIRYSSWIARRFDDPAFKLAFPTFGSLEYWRDQLITLEEQLQLIQLQ